MVSLVILGICIFVTNHSQGGRHELEASKFKGCRHQCGLVFDAFLVTILQTANRRRISPPGDDVRWALGTVLHSAYSGSPNKAPAESNRGPRRFPRKRSDYNPVGTLQNQGTKTLHFKGAL